MIKIRLKRVGKKKIAKTYHHWQEILRATSLSMENYRALKKIKSISMIIKNSILTLISWIWIIMREII
jgi:hypothetical protein